MIAGPRTLRDVAPTLADAANYEPDHRTRLDDVAAGYDRVALVLQGGGALGAYQVGVYQALHEARLDPSWLSGVSIGAVNASIIAGNHPEHRLPRLRAFWKRISSNNPLLDYLPEGDFFRQWHSAFSAHMTTLVGANGFFGPRFPGPWLAQSGTTGATSFYDTAELRDTLVELIDFDLLNSGEKRLSLGAVNVRTGNFIYFDSAKMKIEPEHIMASGALPPGLPSIKIDGDYYWDGGVVSNTPLQYLLEQEEELNSLVFQVDLFSALGNLPRTMAEVMSRHKDIMYSSRTRQNTDYFRRLHNLRVEKLDALRRVPIDRLTSEERSLIDKNKDGAVVNIIQLIYQQKSYEGHVRDYEFSGLSMKDHWFAGYEDTRKTLDRREWLTLPSNEACIVMHDIHRGED